MASSKRQISLIAAALLALLALVAGCSAGTTPTIPSAPSSAPASTAAAASVTPRPGCNDDNDTRKESYAPGGSLAALSSGQTVSQIRSRGRLIAAVSADNLLFGYRNPQTKSLEGFDIDMVRAVAQAIFPTVPSSQIDSKIEYRVVNFAQRIPALTSGQVDIVADIMTINCTRWNQIAFSAEYFAAAQQLLVPKGSALTIEQANAEGKTICSAEGSTGSENLATNYKQVKAKLVPDISDCLVLFQQGQVDGIVSDNTVVAGFASQDPYAQVVPQKITNEPYGLGINSQQTDLVQFVNALLEQMHADGAWTALYNKWLLSTLGPGTQPTPLYGR